MNSLTRRTAITALLAALPASRAVAQAAYPDKPIRLVVPFAPGGNADLTGRLFAEALAKPLGQQVIVENRGGAGGAIGAEAVAKSPPDGYSLVLGSTGTFLVSPRMTGGKPPYTLASFAPVALLSTSPMDIVVNVNGPIKDWPAMLAYLRANPGKLTIGHPGNGSTNHLALLQMQKALDVRFNIIPYKSNGLALNDLLAGQIDAVIDQVPASIGHIRGGRLRAIVVTTARRASQLPDVPTLQETGVKDFASTTPIVLMAPAGTPPEIVKKLNEAVANALADPAVKDKLNGLGAETEALTPQQLTVFLQKEDAVIEELQKSGLLKPE
ncbi:tripartite tricarboxylate transporter substrate binding protein [Reyranella sp.]|jgi:tripartite-type tricarboxylate transporter receptor subunit TctC|uniref:Bug family tripartite tricarboxylate transporter substrate binding protein n=1 Tax=Reyranella sp. TaxID=1929291 RepID=UPI002728FFB3|nr:tripartite tricarboxylate transporter substrate binding protein [Reyranella sp.]MDO8974242.1 tripartite tricarboxylate transporter substrate binding protein [Reyranella sp.]